MICVVPAPTLINVIGGSHPEGPCYGSGSIFVFHFFLIFLLIKIIIIVLRALISFTKVHFLLPAIAFADQSKKHYTIFISFASCCLQTLRMDFVKPSLERFKTKQNKMSCHLVFNKVKNELNGLQPVLIVSRSLKL